LAKIWFPLHYSVAGSFSHVKHARLLVLRDRQADDAMVIRVGDIQIVAGDAELAGLGDILVGMRIPNRPCSFNTYNGQRRGSIPAPANAYNRPSMKRSLSSACAVALLLCFSIAARADPPTTVPASRTSEFLRFVPDGKGSGTLQTAEVDYKSNAGVIVHLVGAVHVADPSYYRTLNDDFKGYDALLYEMVKPRGADVPHPGEAPMSAIGMFQHWMKDVLKLDYQLDDIDYTAPNFVHADLDWETFTALQSQRGESMLTIMLQSMLHSLSEQSENQNNAREFGLIDLVIVLQAPDRAHQMKLMIAQQFGDIEDQMSGLTGPNGSVIITERNKKALEVLQDTINTGKKNVGLFYGAAHLADMSQRLEAMGFKPTGKTTWRVAWDMSQPPVTQPATGPAAP
jgi:hypothetical protein